jgi:uncharacterized OB-fold protein
MSQTTELPETLTYHSWASAVKAGRLLGQECPDCGRVAGTPKAACAHCGSLDVVTVELPTTGEVYTVTTVMVPPEQFEERGYQVAVVQLGEARVMARIVGEEVSIGDEVELDGYIDTDDGHPAPVFSA